MPKEKKIPLITSIDEAKYNELLEDLLNTCRKHLREVDEDLVRKGFKVAFEAHKNDYRASGEPYFLHPLAVAKIVAEEISIDDVSVVAALLHDVVEDTAMSIEFIKKEFGETIAEIVNGVTKIGGIFKGQEINQAENYRKLLLSMVNDLRVILVKFADRLHNMRTLDYVRPEKQRRIARETLEIYAPFANRFGLGKIKWELEDLSFKYLNREAYNELASRVREKREEREKYIAEFIKPIKAKLEEEGLKFEISGRAKHLYSIYRKMIKRNTTFENIYDLLAIRIIIEDDNPNVCYYVLGIINQMYRPLPDRFKDYIAIPKKNNYQSLHNTVLNHDGRMVEIQIRTRKMHEIAERGVAAHWKYKEAAFTSDKEMEEWVNWIRDVFENASKDEATREILASFQMNLYQDEIYVFTPKGDLLRLPAASTPVDFAYAIHSKIGEMCIGAKVNGKIVPLNSQLRSGDVVEIITSKNQRPNENWLQFVKTHKAKNQIRRFINRQDEEIVQHGKKLWEKKIKKMKLSFSDEDLQKLSNKLHYESLRHFFRAIGRGEIDLDEVLKSSRSEEERTAEPEFNKFTDAARQVAGGVVIEGEHKGFVYHYANCCNPIPGDQIIGYVTIGHGVTIHRKDCRNLINLAKKSPERLIPVEWPKQRENNFIAAIALRGEDNPGILKDISNSITNYKDTNIHSINIKTEDGFFSGFLSVFVNNLEHLNHLIARLKKVKGVYVAERMLSGKQQ